MFEYRWFFWILLIFLWYLIGSETFYVVFSTIFDKLVLKCWFRIIFLYFFLFLKIIFRRLGLLLIRWSFLFSGKDVYFYIFILYILSLHFSWNTCLNLFKREIIFFWCLPNHVIIILKLFFSVLDFRIIFYIRHFCIHLLNLIHLYFILILYAFFAKIPETIL